VSLPLLLLLRTIPRLNNIFLLYITHVYNIIVHRWTNIVHTSILHSAYYAEYATRLSIILIIALYVRNAGCNAHDIFSSSVTRARVEHNPFTARRTTAEATALRRRSGRSSRSGSFDFARTLEPPPPPTTAPHLDATLIPTTTHRRASHPSCHHRPSRSSV